MDFGEELLFLTPKGTEELRSRAHRLDFAARNILFLIQQGFSTAEAILQRTIFPADAVMDRLGGLLGNKFVAVAPGAAPAPVRTSALARAAHAVDHGAAAPELPRLSAGIALSQAHFALSDFCLEVFGTQGQGLVDAVTSCTDVDGLQVLLDRIGRDVRARTPARLTDLADCVRGINDTDPDAPAAPKGESSPVDRAPAAQQWSFAPGASVTQARFALADFCLDQFGVRGQALVSGVTSAASLAELEPVLAAIRLEVAARCPDRMPVLWDCIQGINGTSV